MKAIVLCAGRGARLGPHTLDRPKCLVDIAGRPLLSWQIASLSVAHPVAIGVVVGWQGHALEDRGLTVFYNNRWAETTMVDSLSCANDWLMEGVTLVSYGDIIYGPDTVLRLAASDAPISITYDPGWRELWQRRFSDPILDAESFILNDAGYVQEIGGRPASLDAVEGQYMGLLRFTPEGWRAAERVRSQFTPSEQRLVDMTGLLNRIVREGKAPIAAIPTPGPWCEFDHPSDLDIGRDIVAELARSLDE